MSGNAWRISRLKILQTIYRCAVILSSLMLLPSLGQAADTGLVSIDMITLIAKAEERMTNGDLQGALAVFDTAMASDANNAETLQFAERLSQQMVQSLTHEPDNTRLLLALARYYEHFGLPGDAMRQYQQIIVFAPDSADASDIIAANTALLQSSPISLTTTTVTTKERQSMTEPVSAGEDASSVEQQASKDTDSRSEVAAPLTFTAAQQPIQETITAVTDKEQPSPTRSTPISEDTKPAISVDTSLPINPDDDAASKLPGKEKPSPSSTDIVASDVANLIAEGKNRMDQDPLGALQIFEMVLVQDPDNAEIQYYAGNLSLQLNRPEQGLAYLRRSVELSPEKTRLLMVLARAYERFGDTDDAIREYQQVITRAPDSPEARDASKRLLLIAGNQALMQDDHKKASQSYSQLLTEHPDDQIILAEIIAFYAKTNRIEDLQHLLESVIASNPDNRLTRSTLAEIYDRSNNYPKAIEHYEQLIQLLLPEQASNMPQRHTHRLNNLKGLVALQNNAFGEARDHFENFLSSEPDNIAARINLASAYRGLEERAKTEEILLDVVHDDPDNSNARMKLAALYQESERIEDAARELEVLRIQDRDKPERTQVEQFLANVYSSEGGDKIRDTVQGEIIQDFRDHLSLQLDDYETWSKLGFMYLVRQEFEGAREAYENMSRIKPEEVNTRIVLATIINKTGDNSKAEELLLDITQSHPDNIESHIQLGALYMDLGRMTDAARQLEKAKIIGKESPLANQAIQLLAQIYASDEGKEIKQQVKEELIQPLQVLVEEEPDNLEARSELADTYFAFSMIEEAREAYENLIGINPEDLQAQIRLAELHDRLGDLDKAVSVYVNALDLIQDPEFKKQTVEKLRVVQGKLAMNDGDMVLAEKTFKEVVAENPQNFIPHFYLGAIYGEQNKFDDAIREYQQVIKLVPAHAMSHMNLARLYEQVKRDEDALAEYYTALRLGLPENFKENAQQRITALEKRINGFTYTFNYLTGFQSNINLTKDDPVEEFVHNLSGSINYRNKLDRKPIYWGMILSSTYAIYQEIQFDLLNLSATPYTVFTLKGLDYTASVNVSETRDFLLDTERNKSSGFNADVSGNFRMSPLMPWLASERLHKAAPSTWRFSIAARDFETATSTIYDARNYSVGATINQSVGNGWSWTAGYDLVKNDNTDVLGNDLAYISNGISLQMTKLINTGFSINGDYNYVLRKYTNKDSATLFTKKRTNKYQRVSGGLNYFINEKLRLFTNVSYAINESNLPTGFVFSPTDIGTAVAFQTTSLGDYTNLSVTTGFALTL